MDAQCDKLATVVGHQFITLNVHLCVAYSTLQHGRGRNTAHYPLPSHAAQWTVRAPADVTSTQPSYDVIAGLYVRWWRQQVLAISYTVQALVVVDCCCSSSWLSMLRGQTVNRRQFAAENTKFAVNSWSESQTHPYNHCTTYCTMPYGRICQSESV